jgi:hypothetical protein
MIYALMKIDRHISELLYNHDCVIVPAFGGFLASHQATQFQSTHQTFYPPSKKIAFNVFLKNNDGLLANHIAHSERLTYGEALKGIERFRAEVTKLLEGGQQIIIEDVGTLFYDHHKNLQFEPTKRVNYLEEAFGLTAIQSPAIKRDEQRKRIERQIRKAGVIRSSERVPPIKYSGQRISTRKVVNTLFVTGAVLWLGFNIYITSPLKCSLSSLNPFSYSTIKKTEPVDNSFKAKLQGSSLTIPAYKPVASVERITAEKQPSEDNPIASGNPAAHKETAMELQNILDNQKNFFIIAGVFREPGNAEKLVISLQQEGFARAEIVNPLSSIKKVCYGSFAYRKDAEAALQNLRSVKREGWILAR